MQKVVVNERQRKCLGVPWLVILGVADGEKNCLVDWRAAGMLPRRGGIATSSMIYVVRFVSTNLSPQAILILCRN